MPVPFPSKYSKRHYVIDERVASFFVVLALMALMALMILLSMLSGGAEMINYESYMKV